MRARPVSALFPGLGAALIVWALLAAAGALAAGRLEDEVEEALLARFRETDTFRTDEAVLLSSRYRYAVAKIPAGVGREKELASILARCLAKVGGRKLPLERVDWSTTGPLLDGGDPASLLEAIASARRRLAKSRGKRVVFGTASVTAGDLVRGLDELEGLLKRGLKGEALDRAVRERFDGYRSPGPFGTGEVLFTSYASPVYAGSLQQDARHRFPIYRNPSRAGLSAGSYDRAAIYSGALSGRKLEIAWLAERMDEFQLQIEGSGFVRLPDDTFLHVTYAAKNGRPYRSLGKAMVRAGLFKPWDIDNFVVRRYFRQHPEAERKWLEVNPSFVFFDSRRIDELPRRSELVGQRSVAADASYFPRGMLAFADTRLPVYDGEGLLRDWRAHGRFVIAQDVGGAIKGSGRIDLYQGEGEEAQRVADTAKEPGALYVLVPKGTRIGE